MWFFKLITLPRGVIITSLTVNLQLLIHLCAPSGSYIIHGKFSLFFSFLRLFFIRRLKIAPNFLNPIFLFLLSKTSRKLVGNVRGSTKTMLSWSHTIPSSLCQNVNRSFQVSITLTGDLRVARIGNNSSGKLRHPTRSTKKPLARFRQASLAVVGFRL